MPVTKKTKARVAAPKKTVRVKAPALPSSAQYAVLQVVSNLGIGSATQKNIAAGLGITAGATWVNLKRLADYGWIKQKMVNGKPQSGSWHLTKKGAEAVVAGNAARDALVGP